MKRVVFLLCLVAALSLSSCQFFQDRIESDNDATIPSESDYSSVIGLYKQAIDVCSKYDKEISDSFYAEKYGITDTQEKELFAAMRYNAYLHYAGRDKADSLSPIYKLTCGYAQKDLNGDGADELILLNEDYTVIAIFSYADGKPVLIGGLGYAFPDKRSYLDNCWIDGDGFIYDSLYNRKTKYRVAQGGTSLEAVADYWPVDRVEYEPEFRVVTEYYMLTGDEEIEITESEYKALDDQHGKYLGQYSGKDVTREYSGLEFIPLFNESELIKDIYESVLSTKAKVYEVKTGEYKFLKDVRTPYENKLLADVTDLKYGFVDLDGDGIGEVILDCGDKFILRYYNRKVYLYSFTFKQISCVNTDSSFIWTYTDENHKYGSDKIYFEGEELKTKELWRIVNDGETDAEYYINGECVSHGQILEYLDANPQVSIEYLSMDESWNYRLSLEEAYELAIKYMGIKNEGEGAAGTVIHTKAVVAAVPNTESVYYHILSLSEYYTNLGDGTHSLLPHHIYINYELLVNSTTGECFKIEIEKKNAYTAIDIAKRYWDVEKWKSEINAGIKTVSKLEIADFAHCENPYYKVVFKREYYVYTEDASIDDMPYKVEILNEVFIDSRTDECMESIPNQNE